MKLLQLNMWMGRFTPQILSLIQREQPDIITAQEIYKGGSTVQFPDNMFDLFEKIDEIYPYSAFSAAHATVVAHSKADMGNAIFSKFPITFEDNFFTSGEYVADLTRQSAIENSRTLQVCRLSVDGSELHILNHHGYWDISPLGNETSIEKMQLVADHVRTLDTSLPLIFAGDLNVIPESPAMRPFDDLLHDLVATHNVPSTLADFRKLPPIACDHVLINNHVTVTDFRVIDDLVSDHKAIIMEFTI